LLDATAVRIKLRLEPVGESLKVGDPALASLRPFREQPHHRDTGRAGTEMDPVAVRVEERLQLGPDPMCPLDRPV